MKRMTIRSKLMTVVSLVTILSLAITSALAFWFMMRLKSRIQENVIAEMEKNVYALASEKVELAQYELQNYTDNLESDVEFIKDLYAHPDKFVRREVPMRSPNASDDYLMQRSFVNERVTIDMVKDELELLANLESVFAPLMKKYGDNITSIYAGTESGFMLSYDRNASVADYSDSGEVYFDHKSRYWYISAKGANKLIYSDLSQDFFGRGLTLSCAMPFYNGEKFAGVLGIDILVKDLQRDIVDIDIDKAHEGDYGFLVDAKGDIIASPYVDANTSVFENIFDANNKYYSIRKNIISGKQGISHVGDFYCSYAPIQGPKWVVCSYIPEDIVLNSVYLLEAAIRRIQIIFVILFIVILDIVVFFVRYFSKKLTDPIVKLEKDVRIISEGNLDRRVEVIGNDEISDLARAFNNMTASLKKYIHDYTKMEVEKERIGAELNVATNIQASMLPSVFPAFPEDKRFDIFATMSPAKEVGGDFYDFFKVDEKHLAIVVADVSGKGVPAALFMAVGKASIKDHTFSENNLATVFEGTNRALCEANSEGLFITAFEGLIDLDTGHMSYVNAGHEMPYIYRVGGKFEPLKLKPGFVLAGMEDMKYTTGEIDLKPGDKIFQYTDGVTEATDEKDELYGMDRLTEALNKNSDKNVTDLLPAVRNDIDKFVGNAPQFDDITMLGFEYKGN